MRATMLGFCLLLSATTAAAQPAGQFTFDVPLRWTASPDEAARRERAVGADVSFDHLFADGRARLLYEMTMDSFGEGESFRTWLHNVGATATIGNDTRALELGGSAFWRANEGAWADAGFRGVNLLASARARAGQHVTLSSAYGLYVRSFADQPALDQTEHFGSLRMLANLATRTTLAGSVSIGRKQYDGRELVPVDGNGDPPPVTTPAPHGGGGFRRGPFVPTRVETVGESGARLQWSWAARLAQSVDDRTGIWIEREERRTHGALPPAVVWTPPLFYDDGVYDDPYVIDAKTWRSGVKHVFAAGHELGGWVSSSDRNYAGLTRVDTLRRAGIEAAVPVIAGAKASLDLLAGYSYFQNASSEPLESYRAHQLTAGMRVGF